MMMHLFNRIKLRKTLVLQKLFKNDGRNGLAAIDTDFSGENGIDVRETSGQKPRQAM
jgi:hypothetical protein